MHQALYRKYRPQTFDDVYGQDHITSVLKYQVAEGKVSHAYLFCGTRGTGKTTCAKILARAVNCLNPKNGDPCGECEACRAILEEATVDILEMDAASNTGVDYIRDIRDAVVYPPAMLKTRVYIIDEVHMLSKAAFNALLKTLEEPPSRVIFILATTELQSIPVTVLSRCQRFDFKRIRNDFISKRLEYIAQKEALTLTPDGAKLIARLSNGGMRDAISLLEVAAGQNQTVDVQRVRECAGVADKESIIRTVKAVKNRDFAEIFLVISELYASSMDVSVFWQELISFYRDMMLKKASKTAIDNYDLTDDERAQIEECASLFSLQEIIYGAKILDEAYITMQQKTANKRIVSEASLIKLCDASLDNSTEALSARLSALERKIALSGTATINTPAPAPAPEKKAEAPKAPVAEKAATPAQPKTTPTKTQRVADWPEIIKAYVTIDPSGAAFLGNAQATLEDTTLVILADSFAKSLIEKGGNMNGLMQAVRMFIPEDKCTGIEIREAPKQANSNNAFDDLLF